MSVTSCRLHPSSMTGEYSAEGRKYSAAWIVLTDDEDDGAQTIIDYVTRHVVDVGDPYDLGNDYDRGAALKTLKPTRVGERSKRTWLVHGSYEPLAAGKKDSQLGEDGKPTPDPLQWYDRVSIRETRTMRAVERAIYHSGLVGMAAQKRLPRTAGAVCNSAGVVFDPPLERRETQQIVVIERNLPTFPQAAADALRDAVNSQRIFVGKRFARYEAQWAPLTAMVESLVGQFRFENEVAYWDCALTVALNNRTWREFVLDRGLHAAFDVGFPDPDDPTQVISFTDARIRDGVPPVRRLVDHEDRPITEPVRLDGNGQPLASGAPDVYLEYATLVERHWLELQILGFFD